MVTAIQNPSHIDERHSYGRTPGWIGIDRAAGNASILVILDIAVPPEFSRTG